jgi:peptidoglycan-associated lipoprotein
MTRSRLLTLLAVSLAATLADGCGPKRPPVTSTTPGGRAAPAESSREAPERVEPGPDVEPIGGESAMGEDLPTSAEPAAEGGGPLEDIYFDYDQATLSEAGRATLEKHAVWLQTNRSARVTVEGHCDERGTVEYNLALGEQRAQAARDYLASLGVDSSRLTTVSLGKERPLDPSHNEQAWSRNRRAHFVVLR